jgi:hypothetical protein
MILFKLRCADCQPSSTNMRAQKYFDGRFLMHFSLYDRQRATPSHLRGPLNFKLE